MVKSCNGAFIMKKSSIGISCRILRVPRQLEGCDGMETAVGGGKVTFVGDVLRAEEACWQGRMVCPKKSSG